MKKILIFMMLAFSVVMYASPPPDPTPSIIADNVQLVVQAEVQNIQPAVQEVAFVYLGKFELAGYQEYAIEPVAKLEFPVMVMNDYLFVFAYNLNKPPSTQALNGLTINKQHCNFGYPFTGN